MEMTPLAKTLVELLSQRADQTPEKVAYTFLEDGEEATVSLTYAELNQQARAIAAHLQQNDAVGERALLLYPSGLEYIAAFFGCLYAGVLAVPLYPPRARGIDARIQAISQDAGAILALSTSKIANKVQQTLNESSALEKLQWVATDQLAQENANAWEKTECTDTSLAYLQYTFGSTSIPKGMMVSHGNLLYNMAAIAEGLVHGAEDLMVSWLPLYHDLGLIFGILYPLYQGMPCVFMSSTAFAQRPYRWLQAISRYRATHSVAPNFAYDLCLSKISPDSV
ncbi:AMP-binding protein [Chloroflexi bacterium TSY]|nr:AMP-binding protein [Chloroflexi bacterium TSY]